MVVIKLLLPQFKGDLQISAKYPYSMWSCNFSLYLIASLVLVSIYQVYYLILKNMPMALDFCEECEVYHPLIAIAGQLAFQDCERRIQQELCFQQLRPKLPNQSPSQHSPHSQKEQSSNAHPSLTSIQYHLTPRHYKEPPLQAPSLAPPSNNYRNTRSPIHRWNHHIDKEPQPHARLKPIFIQGKPSIPPISITLHPPIVIKSQNGAEKNINNKNNRISVPLQRQRSLLSTIQEEKWDGSELSKSIYSAGSQCAAMSQRQSLQPRRLSAIRGQNSKVVENFEELKEHEDKVSWQQTYKFKDMIIKGKKQKEQRQQKEQKVCWCW